MCNFIGLWHFYNWPVLACEGKEKFSKVSVKLTCLQGRKWFSLTFCFAPWILSSPCVTPAAGAKMYFVNGRPGVLYQENWTMSAFTCLCSFPSAAPGSWVRCFSRGPRRFWGCLSHYPRSPSSALEHLRLWSVGSGSGLSA